jgi:hypothetical protein
MDSTEVGVAGHPRYVGHHEDYSNPPHEKPSATNKVYLMRRLFNLKMSEGGCVADHINEFNVIITHRWKSRSMTR